MEKRHSPPASRFFAIKSKFLRAASVLAALAAAALATSVSPLLSDSMACTAESCFGKQSERNSTRKRNPESGSPAATLILFFLTELTTDQRQFTLFARLLFFGTTLQDQPHLFNSLWGIDYFSIIFPTIQSRSCTFSYRSRDWPTNLPSHGVTSLKLDHNKQAINSRKPFNNPFRNRTTLLNAQTILHKNTLPGRTGHGSLILEVKVFAFRRRQHPATEQNHLLLRPIATNSKLWMSDRSAAANSEKTREDRAASDRRIYGYVDRVTGRADQREQASSWWLWLEKCGARETCEVNKNRPFDSSRPCGWKCCKQKEEVSFGKGWSAWIGKSGNLVLHYRFPI